MSAAASFSSDDAQPHRLSGGLIDRSHRLRALDVRFDRLQTIHVRSKLGNDVRVHGRQLQVRRRFHGRTSRKRSLCLN